MSSDVPDGTRGASDVGDATAAGDTAPANARETILSVRDLETVFHTDEGVVRAVDGVSFDLGEGEILGLVGESGAGKSATARSVLRLIDSPGQIVGGEVDFRGDDVLTMSERALREFRGESAGMIFQDPTTSLNPTMEVGDQVGETLKVHRGLSESAARERAVELLDTVGIPNAEARASDYPHEFSGGQKQRIATAIAVATDPDLLIADEPTTALDVTIQAQILDLLADLRDEFGMSVLFITHDLAVVNELCDRVAVMYAGSIVESGPVAEVFSDPRHPYSKGLLASIPGLEAAGTGAHGDRLDVIEGTMPDLTGEFEGCKYADRCPGATEECFEAHPPLAAVGGESRLSACYHADRVVDMEYEYDHERRTLSWQSGDGGQTDATDGPVLAVEGLEKRFDTGGVFDRLFGSVAPVRAVDGIDLDVFAGETVGLVGESGCGKSTAARSILRLIEPSAGRVTYRDSDVTDAGETELRGLREELQIVFQDPQSSLNPRRTVRRTITRPMALHGVGTDEERRERAEELIEAVGLDARHLDRYPHELSGGQQQRVGIARALAVDPEVIVLDEPVSGLDVSVQAQILNLLADLQEELGLVYVMISHDLSVVRRVCDRVAVMYLGKVMEVGETEDVFSPPYHPYTESLLSAIPGRTDGTERIVLEGDVPDPSAIPSGCRFHPRCPRKIGEVCESETPADHESDGHAIHCHLLREEHRDDLEGSEDW